MLPHCAFSCALRIGRPWPLDGCVTVGRAQGRVQHRTGTWAVDINDLAVRTELLETPARLVPTRIGGCGCIGASKPGKHAGRTGAITAGCLVARGAQCRSAAPQRQSSPDPDRRTRATEGRRHDTLARRSIPRTPPASPRRGSALARRRAPRTHGRCGARRTGPTRVAFGPGGGRAPSGLLRSSLDPVASILSVWSRCP